LPTSPAARRNISPPCGRIVGTWFLLETSRKREDHIYVLTRVCSTQRNSYKSIMCVYIYIYEYNSIVLRGVCTHTSNIGIGTCCGGCIMIYSWHVRSRDCFSSCCRLNHSHLCAWVDRGRIASWCIVHTWRIRTYACRVLHFVFGVLHRGRRCGRKK